MTRNPNPTWIQNNNESRSTTRNPSLTTIHDVARNPNPKRIQDVIRNHNPPRIKDPMTYNGSLITWARVKKDERIITHSNSSNMGLKYKSISI